METKNNGNGKGSPSSPGTPGVGPATPAQQDVDVSFSTTRTRIAQPTNAATRPGNHDAGVTDAERLARRYSREAQLAVEGLLYLGLRWPFELAAALVNAGRKWEEEYYRPTPKRRVSLYDEES